VTPTGHADNGRNKAQGLKNTPTTTTGEKNCKRSDPPTKQHQTTGHKNSHLDEQKIDGKPNQVESGNAVPPASGTDVKKQETGEVSPQKAKSEDTKNSGDPKASKGKRSRFYRVKGQV